MVQSFVVGSYFC